jgi:Ca-activated chloride channel family protein
VTTPRATRFEKSQDAAGSAAEAGAGMTLVLLLAGLAVMAGALAALLLGVGATLADPLWLHLGWGAPCVALLEATARAARSRARARFGAPLASVRLVQHRASGWRTVRALLAAWAILLLAVACARPQWGTTEEEVHRTGVDVWAVVDTSKSMLAEDIRPNRLDRAKIALSSFVDRLGTDRVGLIAFAGEARVVCPLTLDHGAVKLFLELLEPDVLQRPGTAIAPALELARRSSDTSSGRSVVVVLLTDGEDHEGDAVEVAEELGKGGIVVHAIGLGSTQGVPIPVTDAGDDKPGWLKDENGQMVMSRLDADTLKKITDATGGLFYQASSSEIELAAITAQIEHMATQDLSSTRARVRVERGLLFAAAAFVLLALELFLPDGGLLRRHAAPGAATVMTPVGSGAR